MSQTTPNALLCFGTSTPVLARDEWKWDIQRIEKYPPTIKKKTKQRVILSRVAEESHRQPILHYNVHIHNMPLRRG